MVKRILGFSLFVAVFVAVYGAMNYYVYLNTAIIIPSAGILPVQVLIAALALAYPLSQFMRSWAGVHILSFFGAVWMGILSIAIVVFAARDLIALVSPFRAQGLALGLIFALTIWAAGKAWWGPKLKTVSIRHGKLANSFNIVHLSDMHLGKMTSSQWLERVVNQVNSLEADIIVVTGDLVDDTSAAVEKFTPVFRGLRAKYGVYAVSGNHEHYRGVDNFQEFCRSAGIMAADGKLLSVSAGVNIVGIGGRTTRAGAELENGIRSLLSSVSPEDYNILLIHHPVGFPKSSQLGIDLQLSGHTHRGQIPPFNLFVHFVYRYAYGLHSLGDSHIYTSSGTGTWGPPLRLGSNSEIVRIQVN